MEPETPRRIFALSDPHLGSAVDKPMDRFGEIWHDHPKKIEAGWRRVVGEEDLVIVPGDISWGMKLEEAAPDLRFLDALPGTKVFLKGNHDLWWHSVTKLKALVSERSHFLQNNCLRFGDAALCGSRGWCQPGDPYSKNPEEDAKIYKRELERLKLSLKALLADAPVKIAVTHFPPLVEGQASSPVSELIEAAKVHIAVYGHIHSDHGEKKGLRPFEGEHGGVRYVCATCDFHGFAPVEVWSRGTVASDGPGHS